MLELVSYNFRHTCDFRRPLSSFSQTDRSKMVSARVTIVFNLLALLSLSSAVDPPETPVSGDAYRELATQIRELAKQAKTGTVISQLSQNIFELQSDISEVIGQLPAGVSQCETQSVVKLAAAQIGSHEVLGFLTAKTPLAIMSYRLSLCFAFLEELMQLFEEQLELSRDIRHFLLALEFGTNVTLGVIEESEQVVKDTYTQLKTDDVTVEKDVVLGSGFSFGQNGTHWKSTIGSYYFQITPTHLRATRQANIGFGVNPGGYTLNGEYKTGTTFEDGSRFTGGLNGQANFDKGLNFQGGKLGGSLGYETKLGDWGNFRGEVNGGARFDSNGGIKDWNVGVGVRLEF